MVKISVKPFKNKTLRRIKDEKIKEKIGESRNLSPVVSAMLAYFGRGIVPIDFSFGAKIALQSNFPRLSINVCQGRQKRSDISFVAMFRDRRGKSCFRVHSAFMVHGKNTLGGLQ